MKIKEPYILWLPSWYPNKLEPYNGDFIQRHARAASLLQNIHVLFVTEIDMNENYKKDFSLTNSLSEEIVYYKKRNGLFANIRKQINWFRIMLSTIERKFQESGKPLFVHVHVPWKAGLIAFYLKKRYGIPFLLTEHWGIYNNVVSNNYFDMPLYKKFIFHRIFNQAQIFLSVSNYLSIEINKIFAIKRSMVIPNVVDTTKFYLSKEKYLKFTFIHVSNMVPLKNVEGILKAFYLLRTSYRKLNVQLILIGNTNTEYEIIARDLGISASDVLFKGEITNEKVAEEMRKSHCFIMNSNIENSPCVISEALCCGLPIISTDVGGIKELFNVTDGVLIPAKDINCLFNAMCKIMIEYKYYNSGEIALKASKSFSFMTISKLFNLAYKSMEE